MACARKTTSHTLLGNVALPFASFAMTNTTPMFHARCPLAVFATALIFFQSFVHAAVPGYKLGDVATEDVVTPVPLIVVNPDATDALRQKVAQQVQFIVRQTPQSAGEAERELRGAITAARAAFPAALRRALRDRVPAESDLGTAAFANALQEVARDLPKSLPLEKLAPHWLRGASDEAVVASLLQPLREVMAQPVVSGKTENPLPANQSVRLLPVGGVNEAPTAQELENGGQSVAAGKVISLWRARRLVETYFPAGQEEMGRFAASFVRTNAYPDPALTDILRSKRMEGVTANDTYEAAQVIVRKGQTIDRKALSALAVMREKSLIGTLQTKLEQESTVAGQITRQTTWITAGLGGLGLALVVIFWRLRTRPPQAFLAVASHDTETNGSKARALPGGGGEGDDAWRDRALEAEGKAERAQAAIRSGALGLMREKVFQTLSHQRGELLSTQQKAEAEMRELEQRLEQLHTPLQERISAYEKRIEELELDLAAKGEENRELIGARINVARQQLHVELERVRFNGD